MKKKSVNVAREGVVTSRKCGCCDHHEVGIVAEDGYFYRFKTGMKVVMVEEKTGGDDKDYPELGDKAIERAKGKEAWEKPQSEFLIRKPKEFPSATEKASRELAIGLHKKAIERALSEGKPVPPEVLKDYPDLKPKQDGGRKGKGDMT